MARSKANQNHRLKVLLISLGVALAGLFLFAGTLYRAPQIGSVTLDSLPDVDAVVCLAGGRGRIRMASDLWYRYSNSNLKNSNRKSENLPNPTPALFLSGLGAKSNWATFANQVRTEVLERIDKEDVTLEKESSNTLENAQFFLRAAKEKNWDRILLVTANYHIRRAQYLFEREAKLQNLPNLKIYTYALVQEPFTTSQWYLHFEGIQLTLQEYLKLIFAWAFF